MKASVQIIDNDDVKDLAKKHYPNLYREVIEHDKISNSSWYELTQSAYEEFKRFRYMMHQKKLWKPIKRLKPVYWNKKEG